MVLDPNNLSASPSIRTPEQLYAFQYKPNSRIYTFRLSKLLATFGATEQEVQAGVDYCDANPGMGILDGPLKGRIIQTISPEGQDAIREAYRKKLEDQKQQMTIGPNQTLYTTQPAPYIVSSPAPYYHLAIGEFAMQDLKKYEEQEWKSHTD